MTPAGNPPENNRQSVEHFENANFGVLTALVRIHALSSPGTLMTGGMLEAGQDTGKLWAQLELIKKELELAGGSYIPCLSKMDPPLSANSYALPPELQQIHPRLVSHLTAPDTTNAALPFIGMLLHGIQGTGKTEYMRYLDHEGQGRIQFLKADISQIRSASSPGTALQHLFLKTEAAALQTGIYHVLFFDEGDLLFAPHAAESVHKKIIHEDRSSEKRSNVSTTRETTNVAQIDPIGLDILTTLKSMLGGNLTRVFTCVTSNRAEFPEPLTREGRLQKIELRPLSLGFASYFNKRMSSHYAVPDYDSLRAIIPRTLDLFQAANHRITHRENPVLTELRGQLAGHFADPVPLLQREGYVSTSSRLIAKESFLEPNEILLRNILKTLDFELPAGPIQGRFSFTDSSTKFSFGGLKGERGDYPLWDRDSSFDRASPEYTNLQGLLPSRIAACYKSNMDHFNDLASAKKFLGLYLFPQLAEYPAYQEWLSRQSPK